MEVIVYQSRDKKGKAHLHEIQKFLHENGVGSHVDSTTTEAALQTYQESKWFDSPRELSGKSAVVARYPYTLAVSEENADKARDLIRAWEGMGEKKLQPTLRKVHIAFFWSLLIAVVGAWVCAKWLFDDYRLFPVLLFGLGVSSFTIISLLWDRA